MDDNAKKLQIIARQALGFAYRSGGRDPATGIDCWGLVYWVLGQLGIHLPDYTDTATWTTGGYERFLADYHQYGVEIALKDIQPGDVVWFRQKRIIGHVGVMVDRHRFIHCSEFGGVKITRLSEPYYVRTFVSVTRARSEALSRAATAPEAQWGHIEASGVRKAVYEPLSGIPGPSGAECLNDMGV